MRFDSITHSPKNLLHTPGLESTKRDKPELIARRLKSGAGQLDLGPATLEFSQGNKALVVEPLIALKVGLCRL
jgi:hypothetical protein